MNAAGAEQLDRYTHILRTDVDTFITPAWNEFYPTSFHLRGNRRLLQRRRGPAAAPGHRGRYGLVYRGLTNIHSTWYGPTEVVRRASAFSEMLTKHILTHYFADCEGEWPGWYRGVASLYAGEIAVNHCAPDAQRSELLDASSTSQEPISRYAHIHCWHTDEKFSKHVSWAAATRSRMPKTSTSTSSGTTAWPCRSVRSAISRRPTSKHHPRLDLVEQTSGRRH